PPARAARIARPPLRARRPTSPGRRVNARPAERTSTADIVSGFLSVIAIFAALFSLAYRPIRVDVFAIILAFVAAGLSGRNQRLAGIALLVAGSCFILGLVIAILTDKPLF